MGRASARLSRSAGLPIGVGVTTLAVALWLTLTVCQAGHASAATSKASFCANAYQLQSWIAQQFLPGVDQYQVHPNPDIVKPEASYLRKLAGEAPAAIKHDLAAWAAFTERVAVGAKPADLEKDASSVTATARRVGRWLASKTGCDLTYTVKPSKGGGGVSPVVIGAIAVGAVLVAVLAFLGWLASRSGSAGRAGDRGQSRSSGSGPFRPTYGTNQPQKCSYPGCNKGKIDCYQCQGHGSKQDPVTSRFHPCPGRCVHGKVTCPGCHGRGTA